MKECEWPKPPPPMELCEMLCLVAARVYYLLALLDFDLGYPSAMPLLVKLVTLRTTPIKLYIQDRSNFEGRFVIYPLCSSNV